MVTDLNPTTSITLTINGLNVKIKRFLRLDKKAILNCRYVVYKKSTLNINSQID